MYRFRSVTERIKKQRDLIRNRVIVFDSERARILTENWPEIENLPPQIRVAEGLYRICANITCPVEDFELIAGSLGTGFCHVGFNANWRDFWCVGAVDQGWFKLDPKDGIYHNDKKELLKLAIAPEDYEYLKSIQPFWKGRRVGDMALAWHPDFYEELRDSGCSDYENDSLMSTPCGHIAPGHKKIIDTGYEAIRLQAQKFIDDHRGYIMGDDAEKYVYYVAAARTCEAGTILCSRYGDTCLEKAASETDPKRKAELLKMADSFKWISKYPARTYWEACQAAMMYQLLVMLECSPPALAFGRFDQYTWPYLKKDLEEGRITMDEAQEITDAFFLKSECFYKGGAGIALTASGLGNTYQHTTIGGCDPATGKDSSNPVSFMVLETMARLKLHDPTISLRVTKDIPKELLVCAIETTKRVGGLPLLQNDDVIIKTCQKELGFDLYDARNYCFIGCQEIVGSGTDYPAPAGVHPPHTGVHYSVLMDMALNNGRNPKNGYQSNLHTGFLYEMKSFEEVKAAVEKMLRYFSGMYVSIQNYCETLEAMRAPHPSLSISIEGCMENGKDCTIGGAKYNSYGGTCPGLATLADSLTTIKYMCFDKKLCTTRELYDAFMANWEGYEELRRTALSEVPHFGNNDPYADEQMAWITTLYHDICSGFYSIRSKKYRVGMYGASDHVIQGYVTWATPDGRKDAQPLSDAASPAQGRDKNGPGAVFQSSLAYDHTMFAGGMALNIRIHPSSVSSDSDIDKLIALTRTYFDHGGMEVQYNIVSAETMKAAQKTPDEYKDLVVRIAGYSAYFTELTPDCQNDIIARTENVI